MEKKEIIERLEKLHLFFHHVAMDYTGELPKKYAISNGNCQLKSQEDFLIAEGVSRFIIQNITGILSDSKIPNTGKEIVKKFNLGGQKVTAKPSQ